MALTDAEITAIRLKIVSLKAARDSGVLSVKHGETSTTFRSASEIQKAIDALEAEILLGTAGYKRRAVRYLHQESKGL